jgi:hypothetical protein
VAVGLLVVLLRVGSEFREDGIQNSIFCNCMFVIEVIVFGGFFVNVKLFHCVQVGAFFLDLEDLLYVVYLAECVLIVKYVERVPGSVVVKSGRAFVFVESGVEVSSSLSDIRHPTVRACEFVYA